MALAKCTTKAIATIKTFEAQSHGFGIRCLRFAASVTTVDARLASGRWSNATRRDSHPQGHYQRFQISIHIAISPFAKLLGAIPVYCLSLPTRRRSEVNRRTCSIESSALVGLAAICCFFFAMALFHLLLKIFDSNSFDSIFSHLNHPHVCVRF